MATGTGSYAGEPQPRSRSNSEPEAPLKERMYSTWYRLRYGWKFRSSVEIGTSPIWVLGKCYHFEDRKGAQRDSSGTEGVPPHVVAFMQQYYSLTWMTYRTNFDPIPGTVLTTDCGWGCMIRSGQMLLATALQCHLLGREWRVSTSSVSDMSVHKQILSWFADCSASPAPFSLHTMMMAGSHRGHEPGDWFGPSQVAILLRDCMGHAKRDGTVPQVDSLMVYVAHDCTVYIGDVLDLYKDETSKSLLVLVPVRLGGEALNSIYIPCVKSLLSLDHSVGIIGGRPRHSVYFVGFQDDKLIHLDPHYCQRAINMTRDFDIKSYHCGTPRKLSANKMDPSCTLGFYCRNLEDFYSFKTNAEPVLAPPLQRGQYPFFSFSDQRLGDLMEHSASVQFATLASRTLNGLEDTEADDTDDGEDFIVVHCTTSLDPDDEVTEPST